MGKVVVQNINLKEHPSLIDQSDWWLFCAWLSTRTMILSKGTSYYRALWDMMTSHIQEMLTD